VRHWGERGAATHERVFAARALPRPARELAAEAPLRERKSTRSGDASGRVRLRAGGSAAQPRWEQARTRPGNWLHSLR
jgi:hypothetical protein